MLEIETSKMNEIGQKKAQIVADPSLKNLPFNVYRISAKITEHREVKVLLTVLSK